MVLTQRLSGRAIIVMLTTTEQEELTDPRLIEVLRRGDFMKRAFEINRAIAGAIISLAIFAGAAYAQKTNPKKIAEASRDAQKAADAFTEIMNVPERAIPQGLLDKAEAIAVFPGVIKAGFIVGGRGGHGVISRRIKGGWSAPAFFDLGGGSVGLQIGASKTDFELPFMNQEAPGGLLRDKFDIGGRRSA